MTKNEIINIATQFSKHPAGRYLSDGPYSGQRFRDEYLIPAIDQLNQGSKLEIVLDGTRGYGSSFLEEAFGGLLRNLNQFTAEDFDNTLTLKTEDPSLVEEIKEYVIEADNAKAD